MMKPSHLALVSMSLCLATSAQAEFYDDFDDGIVEPWEVVDGTFTEADGDLYGSGFSVHASPGAVVAAGVTYDEPVYFASWMTIGEGGAGFTLKRNGSSFCGYFMWSQSTLYLSSSSLTESSQGAVVPYTYGVPFYLESELDGLTLTIWIDGVLMWSGTHDYCNFEGSGEVGILQHTSTSLYVHDFYASWPGLDDDGDGYCGGSSCQNEGDLPGDCDDSDAEVNPDAVEVCDEIDNNCDGEVDEAGAVGEVLFYADADGDGYGSLEDSALACSAPDGYVSSFDDCDDTNAELNPETVWYVDFDGDGYGTDEDVKVQCAQPRNYVLVSGDCDNDNPYAYPGAEETCDGVDNNCDGVIDEGYEDQSCGCSASARLGATLPAATLFLFGLPLFYMRRRRGAAKHQGA